MEKKTASEVTRWKREMTDTVLGQYHEGRA